MNRHHPHHHQRSAVPQPEDRFHMNFRHRLVCIYCIAGKRTFSVDGLNRFNGLPRGDLLNNLYPSVWGWPG